MIMILTKIINLEKGKVTVEEMRVQFTKILILVSENLICDLS